MKNLEQRRVDSVHTAADFLRGEAKRIPEVRKNSARLSDYSARIKLAVTDEIVTRHPRGKGANVTRALREELREEHMIRISRSAKQLLKFVPGVEPAMITPEKGASVARLVRAARAMAKVVGTPKYRALFVEEGFRKDFVVRLKQTTERLAAQTSHREAAPTVRAVVTQTLAREVTEARKLIDLIDAVLMPRLRSDGQLAVGWRMSKRVGPRLGRPLKRKRRASTDTSNG